MKRLLQYLLLFLGIFICFFPWTAAVEEDSAETVNLAIGKKATQSSTHHQWSADKANDGIRNDWAKCSSTDYATSPFWRLDLQNIHRVDRVVVTNRIDCCPAGINGVEIRVGNSLQNSGNNNPRCAVIRSIPIAQSQTYSCHGMVGQFVNLVIPGTLKVLTLCEVEVYGTVFLSSRSLIKVQLQSSADMTDPQTRDKLLEELETALKIPDASLNWSRFPVQTFTEDAGEERCASS